MSKETFENFLKMHGLGATTINLYIRLLEKNNLSETWKKATVQQINNFLAIQKPNQAVKYLKILKHYAKFLGREDVLSAFMTGKLIKPKIRTPEIVRPSPYQMEEIFKLADTPEKLLLCRLLYETGCRREEIMGSVNEGVTYSPLKLKQIDFTKNQILILSHKTRTMRYVKFRPKTAELLKKFLAKNKITSPEDKIVITNYEEFYGWLKKIGRQLEMPWLSPHKFRKACASAMLANGAPMEDVAKYLGHATAATTQKHYADLPAQEWVDRGWAYFPGETNE